MNNLRAHSLRVRVGKIIAIFSILLVSFYTSLLAELYRSGLTEATHAIIKQEADLLLEAYRHNPDVPLPRSQSLNGYIGKKNLPAEIIELFPPDKWEKWPRTPDDILYRYRKNPDSESHLHLMILELPDREEDLYVTYSITVSDQEAGEVWDRLKVLAIVGGVGVILLLLFFRQIILAAIKPLSSLSRWIENLDEDHPPDALPDDLRNDEIGQVASRLYDALKRIHQHNEREAQFLRNASHELRTPIAIIRNAMDVIEYKRDLGNNDIDMLLQRIRRAGNTMKSVTEAILWLAVDHYVAPEKQHTDLNQMVKELIDDNRAALTGKQIDVQLDLGINPPIHLEAVLVQITLDNIIRNAFQHCDDGAVKIRTRDNQVEVVNHKPAFGHKLEHANVTQTMQTGGFGLGLALVERIAHKQGWRFEFELSEQQAISRLHLNPEGES